MRWDSATRPRKATRRGWDGAVTAKSRSGHVAVDETVIRLDAECCWPFAVVGTPSVPIGPKTAPRVSNAVGPGPSGALQTKPEPARNTPARDGAVWKRLRVYPGKNCCRSPGWCSGPSYDPVTVVTRVQIPPRALSRSQRRLLRAAIQRPGATAFVVVQAAENGRYRANDWARDATNDGRRRDGC